MLVILTLLLANISTNNTQQKQTVIRNLSKTKSPNYINVDLMVPIQHGTQCAMVSFNVLLIYIRALFRSTLAPHTLVVPKYCFANGFRFKSVQQPKEYLV